MHCVPHVRIVIFCNLLTALLRQTRRTTYLSLQKETGGQVSFQFDESDEISASDRHHLQPLLGYDWIAGMVHWSVSAYFCLRHMISYLQPWQVMFVSFKESWMLRTLWQSALMSSSMICAHFDHSTKTSVSTRRRQSEWLAPGCTGFSSRVMFSCDWWWLH